MAQTWNRRLLPCMTVPVRTLNRFAHCLARHRNGIVLGLQPVWTLVLPQ